METLIKENTYIEGLLAAINHAAPISKDLENDLTIDLNMNLIESRGLFVSAKSKPENDDDYFNLDVFVIKSSAGHSCIPVFTNPDLLGKFMGDRNELKSDDAPFVIMAFSQIYEMAMNMPMDITGIVINPEEDSEHIFSLADMEEILMGGTDPYLE